jgi:hypothetical protein
MIGSRSLFIGGINLLLVFFVQGQSKDNAIFNSISIGTSYYYGFNNSTNVKLEAVENSHPVFGEIDIYSQTTGKRNWHQVNGYPELGISLLYGNSGASQFVGNIAALFPFINFTLHKNNFIQLKLKFGLGLGWVQKPFNPVSNYEDLVIGSYLNACLQIQFSAEMKIQNNLRLITAISITHMSNGSIQLPNLGLNIPALSLGLKYVINPGITLIKTDIKDIEKKVNYYLFTFVALKQAFPLESPISLVNILSFEVLKDISRTGRLGGGMSLTFDRALRKEVVNSTTFAFDNSASRVEVSIYGSYEYIIGRLSIPIQLGVYLYNNYPVSEIFEMIGVRYKFSNHWIAGLGLKSHFSNGDFIQWGIGYKF